MWDPMQASHQEFYPRSFPNPYLVHPMMGADANLILKRSSYSHLKPYLDDGHSTVKVYCTGVVDFLEVYVGQVKCSILWCGASCISIENDQCTFSAVLIAVRRCPPLGLIWHGEASWADLGRTDTRFNIL